MHRASLRLFAVLIIAAGLTIGTAMAGAWEDILKAAESDDSEAVIGLLDRGMDVNTSDRTGTTLLMIAARNGNQTLVDFLLRNKANALKQNKFGDTAILMAAIAGRLQIVKDLVGRGVPVAGAGWEPLHYAAVGGQAEVAHYLLSKGAPINARAPNGQTALMLSIQEGKLPVAQLLIDAGADTSLRNPAGRTALDLAVAKGETAIAEALQRAPRN